MKDLLRTAIEDAAASAHSLKEFQNLLMKKYHVTLKISRGRFNYLHPERSKPITGRNLGTHYEEKYLLPLFEIGPVYTSGTFVSFYRFVCTQDFILCNLE